MVLISISYVLYYDHYRSIPLFDGKPEDNLDILRQSSDIDKFYNMYENYGIEIGEVSDTRTTYAFVSTDKNRHITLTAKFFDGKLDQYYYNCSQIEPRERIFLEENTITYDCFDIKLRDNLELQSIAKILDDYVTWYIPLNQINQTAILYADQHVNVYNGTLTPTVSDVTYIDENTLEIIFNKNGFFIGDYEIPNEFELVKQVKLGDKFIATCYDFNDKVFHIDIFHLIKMNNTHSVFDHYGGILPQNAQCAYPEIIEHSFDIKWEPFLDKKN